jgi:hypothetical protein
MSNDTQDKLRLKMVRAIEMETDLDPFYNKATELGRKAARALGRDKRSQITGLESIANSTQKASDVFDYVKLRTARQKEWQQGELGQELLKYLETDLRRTRDNVCTSLSLPPLQAAPQQEVSLRQEVYMRLIRAFVAHLAAQYEFSCMTEEGNRGKR